MLRRPLQKVSSTSEDLASRRRRGSRGNITVLSGIREYAAARFSEGTSVAQLGYRANIRSFPIEPDP